MSYALPALQAIGLIAQIGGTVLGVAGSLQEAAATKDAWNYHAQVADRNAEVQKQNAERAIQTGQEQQIIQDRESAQALGHQFAEQGASGVSVNSRTFVMTRRSAAMLARMDALRVRQAADVEAHNFQEAADEYRKAAVFYRKNAENASSAGLLSAAGGLMSGIGSIANSAGNLGGSFTPYTSASSYIGGATQYAGAVNGTH